MVGSPIFAEGAPPRLMQINHRDRPLYSPEINTGRSTMAGRTIFEKLMAGELPCAKVYEDAHVFAFMDAGQVNPGHVTADSP